MQQGTPLARGQLKRVAALEERLCFAGVSFVARVASQALSLIRLYDMPYVYNRERSLLAARAYAEPDLWRDRALQAALSG